MRTSSKQRRFIALVVAVVIGTIVLTVPTSGAFGRQRKVVFGIDAGTLYEVALSLKPRIEKDLGVKFIPEKYAFENQYEVIMLACASATPSWDLISVLAFYSGDLAPYLVDVSTIGDVDKDFVTEDIVPAYEDFYCKYRGKWLGPVFDGDIHILNYRKDLFEDPVARAAYKAKYSRALRPPRTYDEFNDIASFFTRPKEDVYGATMWCKRSVVGWVWFANRLWSRGGAFFDDNGKTRLNDEIGIWAMKNLLETLQYTPPEALGFDYGLNKKAFREGRAAMCEHWQCVTREVADPKMTMDAVRLNLGVDILPGGWANMGAGRILAMPNDAPNAREDAYAVMKYLASPAVSLDLVTDTRTHLDPWRISHFADPSKYPGLWETGAAEEFCQKSLEAIDKGIQFHIKRAYTYQDILSKYVSRALAGELNAKEAVDGCAAEWDRLTDDIGQDYMVKEIQWYHELLRRRGYMEWMRQANWND